MIDIKTKEELAIMAEAGSILADILATLKQEVRAGRETRLLDERARELCREYNVRPAFLGYQPAGAKEPFPAAICASVNDEIVHGIPSKRILKEGDIITIDMGIVYRGFYADSAFTQGVGDISQKAKQLLAVTKRALDRSIEQAIVGNTIGDIGAVIGETITDAKYSVVKGLTGHGIGRSLHEDPQVLNFGRPGNGEELKEGMVLAIEPMAATGDGSMEHRADGSFVTADGSLSAQFEHTVAITDGEPQVLTARKDQSPQEAMTNNQITNFK